MTKKLYIFKIELQSPDSYSECLFHPMFDRPELLRMKMGYELFSSTKFHSTKVQFYRSSQHRQKQHRNKMS
jgi:hypothetical protein